jgi:tyrosyl-tRNA synthetase
MKIQFTEKFVEKVPDAREGLLLITNLNNSYNTDHSFQFLCEAMDKARVNFLKKDLSENKSIAQWLQKFNELGFESEKNKPSHIQLLSRVLDQQDLPNINPIVNIINAIQITHLVPIGAHDLANAIGSIKVGPNENNLTFPARDSNDISAVDSNEIVHADDKTVLTRKWCWRQGTKDLTNPESKTVMVFINSIDKNTDLLGIAKEIAGAVSKYAPNSTTQFSFAELSKETPTQDTDKLAKLTNIAIPTLETVEINKDEKQIERIVNKAVQEALPTKEGLAKLLKSGRRLRIYYGIDPTAPTLHIGHLVMMRKLEDFRKLGHKVMLLLGTYTGMIGDPTDKKAARVPLTFEKVQENIKAYKAQASSLLSFDDKDNPVEIVMNDTWLSKLNFGDVLELASHFTVQQMLKREMFQKRLDEEHPIFLHEFLYPLMQGYDTVHLKADIELGGNDQLFNMLAGRTLASDIQNRSKFVMTGKLLTTADGKKMGKSEGNMVMLKDNANEIYGKIMAFTDEMILSGFELLTDMNQIEVEQLKEQLSSGTNPMDLKKKLAFTITSELKSVEEAKGAQQYFEDIYQNKVANNEIPEIKIEQDEISIVDLLTTANFAKSKSDARRLVEQGAVKVDDVKIDTWDKVITVKSDTVLRVGKKVVKIISK